MDAEEHNNIQHCQEYLERFSLYKTNRRLYNTSTWVINTDEERKDIKSYTVSDEDGW